MEYEVKFIHSHSWKCIWKIPPKMFAKWCPFLLGLNKLTDCVKWGNIALPTWKKHWFRLWFVAYSVAIHYRNKYGISINWTHFNDFQSKYIYSHTEKCIGRLQIVDSFDQTPTYSLQAARDDSRGADPEIIFGGSPTEFAIAPNAASFEVTQPKWIQYTPDISRSLR